MKLLTHNMLTSHVKGVTKGYPLLIKATEVKVNEVEFNPQFVSRMIPKLEWSALVQAAEGLGHRQDLPAELVSEYEKDEEFLKKVHRALLETCILNTSQGFGTTGLIKSSQARATESSLTGTKGPRPNQTNQNQTKSGGDRGLSAVSRVRTRVPHFQRNPEHAAE